MQKLLICTIRDTKAEAFLNPFVMRSNGEAVRAFGDACAKGDTPLSVHPEDYILYQVGEFDQVSGVVTSLPMTQLCNGADFMAHKE